MLTSRRRLHATRIAGSLALVLLAVQLSYSDTKAAAATQLSEVTEISQLKDLFVEDTGKVRLLTILSPN